MDKKTFKLDINVFVGGAGFDGLRSLCLINDIIDRSPGTWRSPSSC